MLLSYVHLQDGPGPSEAIIEVRTKDGAEEVIVDRRILEDGFLEVGSAIGRRDGMALIELPRESVSGRTRVWVPEDEVKALQTA